ASALKKSDMGYIQARKTLRNILACPAGARSHFADGRGHAKLNTPFAPDKGPAHAQASAPRQLHPVDGLSAAARRRTGRVPAPGLGAATAGVPGRSLPPGQRGYAALSRRAGARPADRAAPAGDDPPACR